MEPDKILIPKQKKIFKSMCVKREKKLQKDKKKFKTKCPYDAKL